MIIIKKDGYTVTKTPEGKYKCSEEGVNYIILNKKNEYWVTQKKYPGIPKKTKTYPVTKYGFEGAVDMSVKQIIKWNDTYGFDLTTKDMKKINEYELSIPKKPGPKKRTARKKVPPVTKTELDKAVAEYLKNGGTITKLSLVETPQFGRTEVDEFLLGE